MVALAEEITAAVEVAAQIAAVPGMDHLAVEMEETGG